MAKLIQHKTKSSGFTVISNNIFRDKTISLKAKGLLCQMLSLPDEWEFTEMGLVAINKESRTAIRSILLELENSGYLYRERVRNADGTLGGMDYHIAEEPIFKNIVIPTDSHTKKNTDKPMSQNKTQANNCTPMPQNDMLDNHTLENDTQYNTNTIKEINNKINKEEDDDKKESPVAALGTSFDNIKQLYFDITGKKLTGFALTSLKTAVNTYGEELVIKALEESAEADKPLKFMNSVLLDWEANNIKTVDEAVKYMNDFKSKKKSNDGKSEERKQFNEGTNNQTNKPTVPADFYYDWMNDDEELTVQIEEAVITSNDQMSNTENTEENLISEEFYKMVKERNPELPEGYIYSLTPEKYEFFKGAGMIK